MNNYEIIIRLVSNRKPTLREIHDFLFCRMRDGDLKYTITKIEKPKRFEFMQMKAKNYGKKSNTKR